MLSLDDVPREVLAAIAAIAIAIAAWLAIGKMLRRARMRARFARGAEGEAEAIAILEAHGYAIEAAQTSMTYALDVDGAPLEVTVRADYLVARGDARFVAEVKTGRAAPRIETPATRRQLLEYHHAFGVDGVLLVDADARVVKRIDFERRPARQSWRAVWALLLAAFAIAVILAKS